MNYQEIMNTSGTYSIQTHLMAMKAGFHCSRLSTNLHDNLKELKFNRNSQAQDLIDKLIAESSSTDVVGNEKLIDELLLTVNSDRVINGTAHTFEEYFEEDDDEQLI